MPAEGLVLTDEDVGMPVASEIDELEIGIAPVDIGQRLERNKRFPTLLVRAFIKTCCGCFKDRKVELTVTCQIQKL